MIVINRDQYIPFEDVWVRRNNMHHHFSGAITEAELEDASLAFDGDFGVRCDFNTNVFPQYTGHHSCLYFKKDSIHLFENKGYIGKSFILNVLFDIGSLEWEKR